MFLFLGCDSLSFFPEVALEDEDGNPSIAQTKILVLSLPLAIILGSLVAR